MCVDTLEKSAFFSRARKKEQKISSSLVFAGMDTAKYGETLRDTDKRLPIFRQRITAGSATDL